jgi:heat shock protein HtpX
MFNWVRRIFLFLLVNLLVMFTINLVLNLLGVRYYLSQRGIDYGALMVICVVWGFGGAIISLLLSKFLVKWSMGIQVIDPENPGGADERWLVSTVGRLAKDAGLSTPEIGIYQSPDPNAFATGPTRWDSLVAVSTGLFQRMEKGEIEAVLGHELTHVANGDMVTLTLIQGVINAFTMFLSRVLAFALTQGRRDDNRGGGMAEYFLVMVFDLVFGILGMIPVMAFSRWREFRADAGGARLAGKSKMISALRELQQAYEQRLAPVSAEPKPVAALKISSRDGMFSLFASHPPLEERIKRLEEGSFND